MPFSLVDPYLKHIKFCGREPTTLEELAFARAEYKHKCRLAEIRSISKQLALLAPFLPALSEQFGIELARRDISCWSFSKGKALRIEASICERDNRLHDALLALGFREIERVAWGRDDLVTLKHGRSLVVKIDVRRVEPSPVAAELQSTPATHS